MSRNAAARSTPVRGRAPTSADVPELAALLGLCATADGTPIPEADEIGAWLNDSSHDVAANFRLWACDDELVAYSDLARWNDQAWLELDVRPDLRGGTLEAELLRWNVERARELGPGSGALRRRISASDRRGLAASQQAGFRPVRHSYLMRIELQDSPEPRPPAGITLRSFQPGEERAVWAAHQESFRDAWDHVQESYEGWHEDRIATPSFDPELWVIAEADDEIAGVSLGRMRDGEGWVGVLGVRKPRRRQGLGAALLRASFRRFWERGERRVALSVDAASPTGAVRLYEREGAIPRVTAPMESANGKALTGAERLRRYAELIVRVGANVADGQYVLVDGLVEHAPLVRELADAAYAAGARFVDVRYADLHVKHSMIEKGTDEILTFTPDWMVKRLETAGVEHAALILVAGNPEPTPFADLDQGRVGRARSIAFDEAHLKNINAKAINWTIAASPSEAWAEMVYGEPDLERLWSDVAAAVRLDADDPVAAWEAHISALDARATAMNEARFDAIQFEGPGTDLTVGLLPGSRWRSAASETSFGRRHVVNLPTEEVFTTPDRMRADGVVRATIDLALPATIVRDLELRLEHGKIVSVEASAGGDYIRSETATDEGAARLGEVALVDGTSRVGRAGRIFYNGLFDENAASHLAYGSGFAYCVEDVAALNESELKAAGVNQSSVHTDFMVGGPEVDVFGVTAEGDRSPIVIANQWQLA